MQVDVAATRLRDAVVTTAEADLTSQAYWLSATLALGAFLKVRLPQFCMLLKRKLSDFGNLRKEI